MTTPSLAQLEPEGYEGNLAFFPPLWIQRRTFVLNVIRGSNVRSVLDLGCGSGALLDPLLQPAFHLDDFPPIDSSHQALQDLKPLDVEDQEIHVRKLTGVDIDESALKTAIPDSMDTEGSENQGENERGFERWEELMVQIWKGKAEIYNERLDGHQIITTLEVIEHLDEPTLNKLSRTILSLYTPAIWIVTTPNYAFNAFFTDKSSNRIFDPTGRTRRTFRNEDHKFEWYPSEFTSWAQSVADRYDYQVTFSGVGNLTSYYGSRWNEEFNEKFKKLILQDERCGSLEERKNLGPSNFYASQIAIFQPMITGEPARFSRSTKEVSLPFLTSSTSSTSQERAEHSLIASHIYKPHPSADHPLSDHQIREVVRNCLSKSKKNVLISLRDLWGERDVRRAAGGRVNELLEALKGVKWKVRLLEEGTEDEEWRRGMDRVIIEFVDREKGEQEVKDKEEEVDETFDLPRNNGLMVYSDTEDDDDSRSLESDGLIDGEEGWGWGTSRHLREDDAEYPREEDSSKYDENMQTGWGNEAPIMHGGKVDREVTDTGGWD